MTTSRRFSRWRRLAFAAQALVALGLPFLRVGGESALRFDVPSLRLHFFGSSLAMDEMFLVLAATLLLTGAFLLATLVLGRAWCGWSCPQTVLGELTAGLDRWRRRGGPRGALALALLLLGAALLGADLVWYFVEPRAFLAGLWRGDLHPVAVGSWAGLSLVLFLDLAFLRARFCATVCPYAKVQGVLFDRSTLVVGYDASRASDCVECGACVRVCPTGIDIRHGLQVQCIACAACIDACEPIMEKLARPPHLIGYFFGEPGGRARLLRPAALALSGLTLAALALLWGSVRARAPLELEVQAAADFAPRRSPEGQVVNTFQVGLVNRGRQAVLVHLAVEAGGAAVRLRPDQVRLEGGESRRLRAVAILEAAGPADQALEGQLRASGDGAAATRPVTLRLPAASGLPAPGGRP
jgi:cytochrome c oxidase accessory protein FixG